MEKPILGEISIDCLQEDFEFVFSSSVIQVHEYVNDIKHYLFYIYCDADDLKSITDLLKDYISGFKKRGHNHANLYCPGIIIKRGVHELISDWEQIGK
ncbi:hypothetical protein CANTEDRAFT_112815 [Yamadazyma tenuis ATCC 10573]|uniref:Uncharacterized protein n=1 Tax=Candida tenuis (strain ATCC 10573 / BCRC 21748 / CBS 615 / JCM 9827 / NBRC 10315 / NRRL Y-1498 / VKM Y-70) TaxID=590646 RepID=G3AYV5_CANTC|nr:uncharacterized protein CANTEDRAFT_112815 [Yamadazyma tenuis ATCC 10573]EGV66252.1 hypothetical protein CANTEDRAFT_112815 [Yamadazyma tenuis ATCC 10573]